MGNNLRMKGVAVFGKGEPFAPQAFSWDGQARFVLKPIKNDFFCREGAVAVGAKVDTR